MLFHHHHRIVGAFVRTSQYGAPLRRYCAVDGNHWEKTTIDWVRRVVIGLNLCPFAKRPLRERQLYTKVIDETNEVMVLSTIQDEIRQRLHQPGTTLVILPQANEFQAFWDLVQTVEADIIAANDWEDRVQVAPFHPEFVFQGSGTADADNYTNRSPFPMIHIIREDDVTEAVATLPNGDAGIVWSRNVELLHTMAKELDENEFQAIFNAEPRNRSLLGQKLRDILRRYPGAHYGSGDGDR